MFTVFRRGVAAALLMPALIASSTLSSSAKQFSGYTVTPPTVVAMPGYQVSVFATGTAGYKNPDSIATDGQHVWVGYQNVTAKDGSDNLTSMVVEYTLTGQVMHTYSVLGHCDGLRFNPYTHQAWALANEDGNPNLTTIDPATGATRLYRFSKLPHGGGLDDMAFTNGLALIDASNPNLNKDGVNVFPALDKITLSNGKASLTPLLMGNASAIDITANSNKKITLNLIDPDSLAFDPQGNLVLDNQAGSQLVFISGVGTPQQYVTALTVGTQVDDTNWATAAQGRLLVSDTGGNTIFSIRATTLPGNSSPGFVPGTPYAATPNDSGVIGFVGTVDETTGIITPVIIGLKSPHGSVFLPDSMH